MQLPHGSRFELPVHQVLVAKTDQIVTAVVNKKMAIIINNNNMTGVDIGSHRDAPLSSSLSPPRHRTTPPAT